METYYNSKLKVFTFRHIHTNFKDTIKLLGMLPGAKYNRKTKEWACVACTRTVELMNKSAWFVKIPEVKQVIKDYILHQVDLKITPIYPEGWEHLWEHQAEFLGFTKAVGDRVIGALDMGTGKTFSAMAWMSQHSDKLPFVVVCPASLKQMWYNNIKQHLPQFSVQILYGRSSHEVNKDIIIVNYDILSYKDPIKEAELRKDTDKSKKRLDDLVAAYKLLKKTKKVTESDKQEYATNKSRYTKVYKMHKKNFEKARLSLVEVIPELFNVAPGLVVFDECQFLRSSNTQTTLAAKDLVKDVDLLMYLTGTPIEKAPEDILSVMHQLYPSVWTATKFKERYCGYQPTRFGWRCTGPTNIDELNIVLKETMMFRKTKQQLQNILPPRITTLVPCVINNRADYDTAHDDFTQYLGTKIDKTDVDAFLNLQTTLKAEQLVKYGYLIRLAVKGKIDEVIQWVNDFLTSERKLVLFFKNTEPLQQVYTYFKKISVVIDGKTKNKEAEKQKFVKNNKIKLLLGNIKSAGVGLDGMQQVCSDVGFVQIPDTPADIDQGLSRVERSGQKEPVNVYYFLAQDTIEELSMESIDRKRKIVDAIVDGAVTSSHNLITNLKV